MGETSQYDGGEDEAELAETSDDNEMASGRSEAGGEVPPRLGRYEIVRQVGEGAMGVVYEATEPGNRNSVAVKAIRGVSPAGAYRFKREFRMLSSLRHPNLVSLYDLGVEGEQLFYAMELVEGVELIEYLCGGPRPSGVKVSRPCEDYPRLRAVFAQVVTGVHAIHCADLVHRDLKPSNVLVTDQGRVVILDFGLVRSQVRESLLNVTDTGAALGTPLYMAPEQAAGEPVTAACDWYAVGVMLYQALVGEAPFAGLGVLALLASKSSTLPKRPVELDPEVPPDLDALCMDLLATDPKDRPDADTIVARLGATAVAGVEESAAGELFVGRQEQLQLLNAALAQARSGRPVMALVEGTSGMGKTALLEHFFGQIGSRRDTVVLSGRCSERESIPYKALDPVMDALSAYLRSRRGAHDAIACLPRDVHVIARLFPSLLTVDAVALAPNRNTDEQDPAQARRRAFDALRELWARLSDRKRLVIAIDDIQWADLDSVVLLDAVLRHPDAPCALLIASFRSGADADATPLGRLVQELGAPQGGIAMHRITVGPMPRALSAQLAQSLIGRHDKHGRALAEDIAAEAEGSPFFVGELVRYAQANAEQTRDIAVNLDNVIRHRIGRLDHASRRLLEVVAVAGGRLRVAAALHAAMGEQIDRAAQARLLAEHLVRSLGEGESAFLEITHDKIREAVVQGIAFADRSRLHLALGEALLGSKDADAVALSVHFRQAGEDQVAAVHTLAAAQQATEVLAFDRAAQLYKAALELGALDPAHVPDVEGQLGAALANAGRLYEAAQAYLRGSSNGQDATRAEYTRLAAELLLSSGHSQEGREVLQQVLAGVGLTLPENDRQALVSLLKQRTMLGLGGMRYTLRSKDAVPGDLVSRTDACWTASRGLIFTDGILGADFHARHLRFALRSGDPVRIARALSIEAHFATAIGADRKLPRANALLTEAEGLADRANSDYARGMVAQCRGHAYLFVGRWAESVEYLRRGVKIFRERCTNVTQEISYCEIHAALCLQYMGYVRELTPLAYQLLREASERHNPYVQGFARGLLGHYALLGPDRPDEALGQLDTYRRESPRRFQGHIVNYVCQTAAVYRYKGEAAVAWETAQRDEALIKNLSVLSAPQVWAEEELWRGASALAGATVVADPQPLVRIALKAAARLLKHPSMHARGYGHLTKAGALALGGQQAAAVECLRGAIEAFEARGMDSFAAAARWRCASLVGGTEGEVMLEQSRAYAEREGIVKPENFVRMAAPGFFRE